jgi:DNA primase
MRFPDGFLDDVRHAADIVSYVSEHVALKKMGTSWKGLCPFHGEKSPSFNVRQSPPVFHCFGCGEGGDIFKFAMLHERLAFPDAVEMLARKFGVPIPKGTFEVGPDRQFKEELFAVLEAAAEHYQKALFTPAGAKAREYLEGRGFDKPILEKLRVGAARDAWSDLGDTLKRRFSVPALEAAGLVMKRQGGDGHYDRFRNRAVFPIFNEGGKVVGFGARSLDGSEPKYLNSPESPVYSKGRVLYGLNWARETIRGGGSVVLMEGYLDVGRCLQTQAAPAVASCGTALTPGQAKLLRRFTDRVVVNFDQDAAGQKATRRSLDVLLEEGLTVSVVELPEGHDPDTFLRDQGADEYRRRLESAPPYMEWLIRRSAKENDVRTPAGKSAYLNGLLPALARIESAVERTAWLPRVIAEGGLDSRAAQLELRKAIEMRAPSVVVTTEAAPPKPKPRARLLPAERWLISLLVRQVPEAFDALARLQESEIERLASAPLLTAARRLQASGGSLDAAALEEAVDDPQLKRLVTELSFDDEGPGSTADPAECLKELRLRPLEERMSELRRQIALLSGDEQDEALREMNRIKVLISEMNRSEVAVNVPAGPAV